MEWLDKLQVPGLVICGLVIWWLFKLIETRDDLYEKITAELAEQGKTLTRMAAILDIICRKGLRK